MKFKHKRKNGYVLMLVVLAISLVGFHLAIMTASSNLIMFQADQAYLYACQDNLKASAVAWAETNTKQKTADKEIQLDTIEMNIPRSQLTVKISPSENQKASLDVTATCSKARNTMTRTYSFQIDSN